MATLKHLKVSVSVICLQLILSIPNTITNDAIENVINIMKDLSVSDYENGPSHTDESSRNCPYSHQGWTCQAGQGIRTYNTHDTEWDQDSEVNLGIDPDFDCTACCYRNGSTIELCPDAGPPLTTVSIRVCRRTSLWYSEGTNDMVKLTFYNNANESCTTGFLNKDKYLDQGKTYNFYGKILGNCGFKSFKFDEKLFIKVETDNGDWWVHYNGFSFCNLKATFGGGNSGWNKESYIYRKKVSCNITGCPAEKKFEMRLEP